jgi:hypothetical protein
MFKLQYEWTWDVNAIGINSERKMNFTKRYVRFAKMKIKSFKTNAIIFTSLSKKEDKFWIPTYSTTQMFLTQRRGIEKERCCNGIRKLIFVDGKLIQKTKICTIHVRWWKNVILYCTVYKVYCWDEGYRNSWKTLTTSKFCTTYSSWYLLFTRSHSIHFRY